MHLHGQRIKNPDSVVGAQQLGTRCEPMNPAPPVMRIFFMMVPLEIDSETVLPRSYPTYRSNYAPGAASFV
jgi:hypothetical protein